MKTVSIVCAILIVVSPAALAQGSVIGSRSVAESVIVRVPGMGGYKRSIVCVSAVSVLRNVSCTLVCVKHDSPMKDCVVEVHGDIQVENAPVESVRPFSAPPYRSSFERR